MERHEIFYFEEQKNLTVKQHIHPIEDYFIGVYGNSVIKSCFLFSYLIGCCGIIGVPIVIWFEKSGEAGNYRTLLNRLSSYIAEIVCIKRLIKLFNDFQNAQKFSFLGRNRKSQTY